MIIIVATRKPPEGAGGGTMAIDLHLEHPLVEIFIDQVPVWIPERMGPGAVFVLENQARLGDLQNPFVAVHTCPRCNTPALITRRQLYGGEYMICGGDVCSNEWCLDGDKMIGRKPQ